MTPVWIIAAVLAAAAAGGAVWWWLARRGSAALADGDAAAQAAEAAIPGFAALETLTGDDRRAALVVGRANRVALVTGRGRGLETREIRWREVRALAGGLRVDGGRPVFVSGVDVLDVRRAGGEEMRREG